MKNFRFSNKLLMGAAIAVTMSVSFSSCSDDDDEPDPKPTQLNSGNTVVSSNISANTTWTKDNVYQLGGRITVLDGVTLTIEPGTIIKGEAGTGANATALLVARGGKLMAEGTAAEPIIFTSVADEIEPGQTVSPNLDPDLNGYWGGVIILGKAPISASANEIQIEGIPTSDANGLYGGSQSADNSGVIKYISIRHGGSNIGAGNEINGLTLGGVGTGTVIENIEVVGNQDDGIEWFGGTVNVKNALVWNAGDDAMDTDQAWSGTMDNFIVVTPSGHCFELDGPEGAASGSHTFINGTVIASDTANGIESSDLINVDANSEVTLQNIHIMGIAGGQQIREDKGSDVSMVAGVTFTGITLDVPSADLANYVDGTVPAGVTAGGTSKADASVFGWTWAGTAGMLTGL